MLNFDKIRKIDATRSIFCNNHKLLHKLNVKIKDLAILIFYLYSYIREKCRALLSIVIDTHLQEENVS